MGRGWIAGVSLIAAAVFAAPAGAFDLVHGSGGRVVAIDADGANRAVIVKREGLGVGSPALSPDGSRIAYVRFKRFGRFDEGSGLEVANADGSGAIPLTAIRRRSHLSDPQWSPDGSELLFARVRETSEALVSEIVAVPASGGPERVIVSGASRQTLDLRGEPTYSPGGDRIVFTRETIDDEATFRQSLFEVSASGASERLLIEDASDADFSPDGSRLAFASTADENGEYCGSDYCSIAPELYVANADGSAPVRLTRNKGFDTAPDWSPDGAHLAFASDRNHPDARQAEIYTAAADGSCLSWLTNGTATSTSPSWNPAAMPSVAPPCGLTLRAPLIETRRPRARTAFPLLWLGRSYRGALLTAARTSSRGADLSYEDCGRFDPKQCPVPLFVRERSACARESVDALVGGFTYDLRVRRGLLVGYLGEARNGAVWSGGAMVSLGGDARIPNPDAKRDIGRAIRHLEPVGRGRPLPASRLPREAFRASERAADALAGTGSVDAAAELLGIAPYKLERRVRLARILERTSRIRQASCD